jgi:hypothetical protein
MAHAIAYAHSAYVLCAVPARQGWHARAMLGECTVADAEGPTAEAALERLESALDRLRGQPGPSMARACQPWRAGTAQSR